MAWNSSPEVAAARNYSKKFNKDTVIILTVDPKNVEVVTYGRTKKLCVAASKFGDELLDACRHQFFEANEILEGKNNG